ncbi:anti-sigma factor antagonist BldG [soil metagenome]
MHSQLDHSASVPFGFSTDWHGNRATLTLEGEIEVTTAPHLRSAVRALLACGVTDFVIDFGEVVFVDSTGLDVLIELLTWAGDAGGSVTLEGAGPQLVRILEVTGIAALVTVRPSQDRSRSA